MDRRFGIVIRVLQFESTRAIFSKTILLSANDKERPICKHWLCSILASNTMAQFPTLCLCMGY